MYIRACSGGGCPSSEHSGNYTALVPAASASEVADSCASAVGFLGALLHAARFRLGLAGKQDSGSYATYSKHRLLVESCGRY